MPNNMALERIQANVFDPKAIGDKAKWYGDLSFIYNETKILIFERSKMSLLERKRSYI